MWNSDHTPMLLGKVTADQFPGTPVTIYLGEASEIVHLGSKSVPVNEGYVHFENAFWQREGAHLDFYVVYTEHLGYFVFSADTIMNIIGLQYPKAE